MIIDIITKIEKHVKADVSFTIWSDRSGHIQSVSKSSSNSTIRSNSLITWNTKSQMKININKYLKKHNL